MKKPTAGSPGQNLGHEPCRRYRRTLERAEAWLTRNFPDSLLGFADRFFTRSIWSGSGAAQTDLDRLLGTCDVLLDVCRAQAEADELQYDITAVLALAYSWRRLEVAQLDPLLDLVAPVARDIAPKALNWEEPARSMFCFATAELGILAPQPIGSTPAQPIHAAYLDLHRIMFATDYGSSAARRDDFSELLPRIDSYFGHPSVESHPDLCAERLLIESMLDPIDLATCQTYANRVCALQRPDGGFGRDDPDAHNHTVTVAATAMGWLVATCC